MRAVTVALVATLTLATPATAMAPTERVDDVKIAPSDFSDPTTIDNLYSPISQISHSVALGVDEGLPVRIEVTLLPDTRRIKWKGGSTEVVIAQFLGITDGEIAELTYDWFAQDDDGNVWYFGEDVANYERGKVKDHHGSWQAGTDGPPGMLMAADPQVGDVWHSENIPGLVFEKDRVLSTTETVEGPQGPIENVVEIREELMEGGIERKLWAPGYGEFQAIVPNEEDVSVVFALPNDVQPDESPDPLTTMHQHALDAYDLAQSGDSQALGEKALEIYEDWRAYGAAERTIVIEPFVKAVDDALARFARVVAQRDTEAAAPLALDLELAVLDVMTTHDGPTDDQRIDALERRRELELDDNDKAAAANTKALIAAYEART